MGRTQNLCYCLMPDHLHWLLVLVVGDLSQTVHNVKRLSQRLNGQPIPWQRGYYDQGMRDHSALRSTARYIVANPLRAGLVQRLGDYSHWDAIWCGPSTSSPSRGSLLE